MSKTTQAQRPLDVHNYNAPVDAIIDAAESLRSVADDLRSRASDHFGVMPDSATWTDAESAIRLVISLIEMVEPPR